MNLNPQPNMKAEQADLRRHVVELEKKVDKLVDKLVFVRGQPIVQAYVGKKFDLNENFNVVELFRYIDAWTLKVTNQVKFRFRGTDEPRLYLEMTIDSGTTWTECTSWPS
jgi:hypothetical protein